jgi:hypothetical protein
MRMLTGRRPATRVRTGEPPDPAFARSSTAAAVVVVVVAGLLVGQTLLVQVLFATRW